MLFNIYYINFPKVYEIKMMLSNIVQTSTTIESGEEDKFNSELKAKMGAKFLNFFHSEVEGSLKSGSSDSQKVLEVFEVKTTKSVVLNEVIEKSKLISSFPGVKEGALIRIDNVKLALVNEQELRTVKIFSSGALKGSVLPQIEGLDLNNALNSMFKDYAYKLNGEFNNNGTNINIMIKIPLTFENELESLYSVDDLFIGKVSIIYKGETKITNLRNSFEFFQELGQQTSTTNEIQNSQYQEKNNTGNSNDDRSYNYIDVLAIVQNIEPVDENNNKSGKKV
jgi:hypothetical protein